MNKPPVAKAIAYAVLSALFFTATYVLNRADASAGGHWAWTASLRYLWTLPMMIPIVMFAGGMKPVFNAMRRSPIQWLVWSFLGFVIFYAALSYAADSGPSWLIAGTFCTTVVMGVLSAPLLYNDHRAKIPLNALLVGVFILIGVFLMQWSAADGVLDVKGWIAFGMVLISALMYPLGNRGLMLHLEREGTTLNPIQRTFGMVVASIPFWVLIAIYAYFQAGFAQEGQLINTAGVALTSGIIATVLFFQATDMMKHHPVGLAAAEAMQALEIVFATLLGYVFFGEALPKLWAWIGMLIVMIGVVVFIAVATREPKATVGEAKK